MTTYGAFARIIPGIDGLIHISQIANKHVAKPQDELTVGEEVEAKIIAVDSEKKRVSLSIRALLEPEAPAEKAELNAPDEVVFEASDETAAAAAEAPAEEAQAETAPAEEAKAETAPVEEAPEAAAEKTEETAE